MAAIPKFLNASGDVAPQGPVGGNPSQTFLYGWVIRETAGAVAQVNIRTAGSTGPIVAPINLAANGQHDYTPTAGIICADGIYLEVVAGAVEAAVYYQ